MSSGRAAIEPGSVWRQLKLEREAIYEVVSVQEELVEVKVLSAPGLSPGARLTLTRVAVAAMDPLGREHEHGP
jgi:hypothetical protein